MHSAGKIFRAFLFLIPLLSAANTFANDTDDFIPEVNDRVARISFLRGDVQVRRADSQDWERAVLNLPLVEGDEIVTDGTGRFEVQFDSRTHLRVAENSHVKITGLQEAGIAVSLPQGSLSLRVYDFDASRGFVEIDAPKTTVSVQKSGTYRVDAGSADSTDVRVSATDGAEARVYTHDSGFTIRNGRFAKIFIDGQYAGEWETSDASSFADEFAEWSTERDTIIARRLRDAHYDRYYDQDIYGAEDLNDHGEWVHTRSYGYVWRPYRTTVSRYADWSPYRYGHWRFIPPFGWTWINDEPWGWATYHHGRWVWDSGYWVWSPYGYHRSRRSWWRPALVVIRIINRNVCWYPLPYHYGYYNYNYHYNSRYPRRRGGRNADGNIAGPPQTGGNPTPAGPVVALNPRRNRKDPALLDVPAAAVVTVPESEFGRERGNFKKPSANESREILARPVVDDQVLPVLPTYRELNGQISREIRSEKPPVVRVESLARLGAAERKADQPLDGELRTTKIRGNRPPLEQEIPSPAVTPGEGRQRDAVRKTGAVGRPDVTRDDTPVKQAPVYSPPTRETPEPNVEPKPRRSERSAEPVKPPVYIPPVEPRRERPSKPRDDSPTNDTPVKSAPPRNDPPQRSEPPSRNERSPKNDPPPQKSEPPKSEPKVAPSERRSKNG